MWWISDHSLHKRYDILQVNEMYYKNKKVALKLLYYLFLVR